jgi:hypothetical protein
LRHGSVVRQDSNIIKELMEKREREREEQLQQAYKKAGRGKKKRHKTVSDMSAMMALASQPEPSKSNNQVGGDNDDAVAFVNIANNAKSWTGPVSIETYCLVSHYSFLVFAKLIYVSCWKKI